MTLDSARGSDGCEASPRLPTGLCGSRIRTDDSLYIPCSGVLLLDDRLAADGHGGAGASHAHQMEALQVDEQITPITTIKRHTAAAGRARHRPRSFEDRGGRSPLITWDLDLYPQPPLNTHSPTLNSEEPVNTSCLVGSAVSTSRGPTMAAPGCHPRPLRKAHTP